MLPKKKRWMADVVHPSPSNLVSLPTPPPTTTITLPNVSNNDGAKKIHCCDTPIQTMNTNTSTRSLPLPISSSSSPQLPPSGKSLQGGNLMSSSDMYGIAVLQQQQRQTNHPQQQTFNNRPGSNTTEHSQSDKSQILTSRQSNHSMKSTPSGRRNDVNANLITTISQYPTELLQQQQPGLLLQVLPQEYLMNYAQNLAKLNANKNSSSETVHTSVNECSIIPSKLNKIDNTSLANITAYSQGLLHQSSDTQGRQTHTTSTTTSTNMSNPSLRIKCSENSKIQRTPPQPTLRSSPMHNSPVFQYPAPTNSQRFSPPPPPPGPAPSQPSQTTSHPPPPRRLSGGSGDQVRHMKPMMTQSHHQHHHQLPPGFDLSSISAVARAASMLSPSQLEAAAALLSQWDNANHLSLLANNPSYRNLCNIAELSGNNKQQLANSSSSSVVSYASSIPSEINPVSSSCYMDNNPIQGVNRSGMTTEAKTRRVSDISSSSSFVNPKTVPSVSIGTMSDLRYSNMKTSPSLPRSMESTNRLNSRSSTPVNEMHKSEQHICCPPWITASGTGTGTGSGSASAGPGGSGASTDQRTYPTDSSHPNKLQPNPRDRDHHHHQQTVELADSRLAILHDAKLASLSVDWPSCTMSQNNNNNNNNNMPMMSKANRIRSSSSSSSSFSSTAACQAVSSLSSTPESSPFSVVNQLATKTVERKYSSSTSSSSPLSSGSSFLPSESMHKTSISGQCSPNVPMTFNFKGLNPHLQTSSSSPVSVSSTSSLSSLSSSCCQTIKPPPSPVIGGHKIPSSTITQSQIVITYSEENSPITTTTTTTTTNTACSPQSLNSFFPIMNTNSTTTSTNNVIEIAGSSSSCKVEVDDRSSINWSGKRSTHQSSELNNNNKRQSTTAYSSSGGLLPSTPPIQIMKQDSIIKNKINDNNSLDQKTQNNNNNNTSMPLKKRLIQRYEADRDIDMKQPSEVKNMCSSSTKVKLTMESAKVQSRPISYSEDMKANHYLSENRLTTKEM
uniref:Uncharacterized protein n=1 Tax=Trichobilharzia regenti TaxID=157069 RepID=A0AA85JNU0_TRIRE|nr:unnamed protein product [Trichobilharzia regenti]